MEPKNYTIEEIKEFIINQNYSGAASIGLDHSYSVWLSDITHENIQKANEINNKHQSKLEL